ncbi:MAG: DUF2892 domain-containing protein [Alicyclobacillus sp.]|nr:DUF2892 domain-containing protein [Alicyclobacillus sp.]
MQNHNIRTSDRYVRLAGGLFLMASALTQRKQTLASRLLLGFGAMKVAEGIMGWCPLMHALGVTDADTDEPRKETSTRPNTDASPRAETDDRKTAHAGDSDVRQKASAASASALPQQSEVVPEDSWRTLDREAEDAIGSTYH